MTIQVIQGVDRHFGPREVTDGRLVEVNADGVVREVQMTFDAADLPIGAATNETSIPANSIILDADLETLVAFATSDAAVLNIGLEKSDGTDIDADGIDASVAVTAMDAVGERVKNDGALVGVSIGADAGYLLITQATGTFTAGRARLTIRYKPPVGV